MKAADVMESIVPIETPNYKNNVKVTLVRSPDIGSFSKLVDDAGTGVHFYVFPSNKKILNGVVYNVRIEGFYNGEVQDAEFEVNFALLPSNQIVACYKNWKNDLKIEGEKNERKFVSNIFDKCVV